MISIVTFFAYIFLLALARSECPTFIEYSSFEEYESIYGEVATAGTRVYLNNAKNNDGAMCLDGSPGVFYWRAGFGDGTSKYHVFLEGGGECAGFTETINPQYDTCPHRATTSLGSSKNYGATANFDSNYMSTNKETNPLTYNWNTVYVKYCDGSDYGSNNETVVNVTYHGQKMSIYFRGFRILRGVFNELAASYNYNKATDILLSGCSAGGIGTFLHCDYVGNNHVPSGSKFGAMPDSGFFLEYQGKGQMMTPELWQWNYMNYSASLNQDCLAGKGKNQELCLYAQETTQYSSVNMFALQSRFDSWQIQGECVCNGNSKDINAYGNNLTETIMSTYFVGKYSAQHHMFLDSCSHHCGEWNRIKIDGLLASQAQYNWWNKVGNHASLYFQNQSYPCPSCCTPN